MFANLKNSVVFLLTQLPGWHSKRKIVVIESDDWGCWRVRDKSTLQLVSRKLPHVLDDPYSRLDTLETDDDLVALFEVLQSVKDRYGRSAVLTANTIVANPDYDKIKASGFQQYFYTPYFLDLGNDTKRKGLRELVRQGVTEGLYRPQLHGREHVNVSQWFKALHHNHKELRLAFDHRMFGFSLKERINMRHNVMAALDFDDIDELRYQHQMIADAQHLFQTMFGFTSATFIPASYIWHGGVESALIKNGIFSVQGIGYQFSPNPGKATYRKTIRYTGKRTQSGILHTVRNALFEPVLLPQADVVERCLQRIGSVFNVLKPVIIGSHRLNFVGGLDEQNRKRNLCLFKELLQKIIKRWPDVEFLSSDELYNVIVSKDSST